MLVLTRKRNESIVIADNIEISIVDISKSHVKIGIKAPRNVAVHRKEIYDAITQENIEAAKMSAVDVSMIKDIFKKEGEK